MLQKFVDWRTQIGAVEFPNPLLLASGVLNETGVSMARSIREGAGGVVTKSMSSEPRKGHPNPTVVWVDGGMLNAMGLPGPGMAHFKDEVDIALKAGAKVVGSVFGADAEAYAHRAGEMEALGVHAIELNVSCPHAKGFGSELGSDPTILKEVVRAVKNVVSIPVWTKLTPNTKDISELGLAAEQAGSDAIVATNTLKAMAIEADVRRPILGNKVGGLSGPAMKPVALRAVWDLYQKVEIPIVASGGISNGKDVLEFAMAGASGFQIGTAVLTHGWGVFPNALKEIEAWCKRENVKSLAEIKGAAHRN